MVMKRRTVSRYLWWCLVGVSFVSCLGFIVVWFGCVVFALLCLCLGVFGHQGFSGVWGLGQPGFFVFRHVIAAVIKECSISPKYIIWELKLVLLKVA